MAITIEGVPETISRDDYTSLVSAYGFDPNRLVSLTFGPSSITAEVIVSDPRVTVRNADGSVSDIPAAFIEDGQRPTHIVVVKVDG